MSSPDARERAELADIALAAARELGELVRAGHRSRPRADEKAARDLVTEFDLASQELLLRRLAERAPGVPIVAEEGGSDGARRGGLVWYVDPLDGTTNFVHGHPFWCVSVGLLLDEGPIAGAVYAPVLGNAWGGHAGAGGAAGVALRDGQPCAVSAVGDFRSAMVATGFPPQRDRAPENNFASFEAVKRAAQAVRRCGSAALDLCLVADGTYDGYWERRLHPWDVVAGGALVLAAGGRVTSLGGGAPDWHTGHLVATNALIHDALLETLARS
ncbi:MAG: inositol monophosphatase family protein [Polyangiaceae bacterium]